MPDFGPNDPLTAAIQGRGGLYNLSSATQPGQGALDQQPTNFQLPDRRQELINRLPYANRRDARAIGAELHSIAQDDQMAQQQMHWEANQRRLMAHDQAEMAAHQLRLDRETEIDEQGAALMNGMGRLDAMHRNGQISPDQFDSGLLDLGQQYQLGTRHPAAGKMFEHFITESDKRNQFNVRRLTSETAKLAGRYGVEPQVDPETGLPSIELTRNAALGTDKGKSELFKQMNTEMLQKYGVPTGVGSLFQPVQPHTSPDKGKTIDLPFLDKQGKIGKMNVPTPMFEAMKSDFQDRYNMVTTPTNAPAQQQSGLQPGTTRNVGGINYSWNGTRWDKQ